MKVLCVLKEKIDENFLYHYIGYLYYIDEAVYKKEIIKGNVFCRQVDKIGFYKCCRAYIRESKYVNIDRAVIDDIEDFFGTNTEFSFEYARHGINGRFYKGEEIISTNALYSFYYAVDVLNDRFELGENAISTEGYYSYRYANDILNGRFELGEEAIRSDPYYNKVYFDKFLK